MSRRAVALVAILLVAIGGAGAMRWWEFPLAGTSQVAAVIQLAAAPVAERKITATLTVSDDGLSLVGMQRSAIRRASGRTGAADRRSAAPAAVTAAGIRDTSGHHAARAPSPTEAKRSWI